MNTAETSIPGIDRLGKTALVVGLAALVLFIALGFRDPLQFFRSYLFAFVFWMGLPLGCTAIRLIHQSGQRHVGIPPAPPAGSGTKTLPLMARSGGAHSFPTAGALQLG